ncbi:iron complex outermembrane receptor protein [Sphingobium sp. OAS761]|uniref:TonB-dependent receptor n=1 Tax=Sphingobium sp. OAS761 TaxID=2817901 RepID=UPI0020A196E4|nr:TonB-dependent receptor [Sphingobium sp. OAS761]MCP1470306.1 iron complex outermembrane receptor protein [Sphingobium sp. OAS761]
MILRRSLFALLGTSTLAMATAAQAQTAESGGIAEIVVTATRQEKSLQDTPAAVDVVTAQDIRNLNIFDVKEVQNLAPGLELTNNSGRSNVATLRGITFDPDSGSAPAVDLFFNEIPTDAQTMFTAIYDIGQIEVLRGPQGLFRGRTSPAGAILIGAQKPDLNDFTGYMQATASNRHAVNVQGAANLPLVTDKLALRAALLYDENDLNSVRNIDGRRPSSKTMSGRISLAYDSGAGLTANLTYQHLNADNRSFVAVFGPGNQPSPLSPERSGPALSIKDRTSVTEGIERFQNRTDFVTLNAKYDLGAAEIIFNGGYQDTLLTQHSDLDKGNAVPDYVLDQRLTTAYQVSNAELRLQSSAGSRLFWAISGNYTHQKNNVSVLQNQDQLYSLQYVGPLPASSAFPIIADVGIGIASDTYGLAGTLGYELTDGLTVTGGLRQTWADINREQVVVVTLPDLDLVLPSPPTVSNLHKKALTGGANISWEATPDLTIYGNYGHSYRQGVFAVGVSVPLDANLLVTPDETSDGFEVGVKTFLLDRKVSLNLAAFYQKFKNYISYAGGVTTDADMDGIIDSTGTPLPFAGDAISKGVEMQLEVRPSDYANFGVNASYTDAHWDNASIPCNDFNGDGIPDANGTPSVQPGKQVSFCTRNDRISRTPKFSLSANGELRIPTGSVEPFVRGLVNYRPGFYSLDDDYRYRAYTKVDLFIGVRDASQRWEISAFAKNLLNQTRVLAASQGTVQSGTSELDFITFQPTGRAGIPLDSGYHTAVLNPPREFGLTLKYNW